jgi:hypothetical protein
MHGIAELEILTRSAHGRPDEGEHLVFEAHPVALGQ